MPIYTPYFIFLALLFVSLLISVIIKKNKEGLDVSSPKPIRITIGIVGLYYAVKIFFGWRFTSWYFEAFLMLCVCFALDYFVIIKNRYPKKTNTLYYVVRISYITVPILTIAGSIFFALITMGWGQGAIRKVFPIDTSYGEQWVYKNLYIYKNDREDIGGVFAFKKKVLFFEKDVAIIRGSYLGVFGINQSSDDPLTGYINKDLDSIIIINGGNDKKYLSGKPLINCIKITILKSNYIKIERIIPRNSYLDGKSRIIETLEIKL